MADKNRVHYLDLATKFTPSGDNWKGLRRDKLHLSAKGYAMWAADLEALLPVLLGTVLVGEKCFRCQALYQARQFANIGEVARLARTAPDADRFELLGIACVLSRNARFLSPERQLALKRMRIRLAATNQGMSDFHEALGFTGLDAPSLQGLHFSVLEALWTLRFTRPRSDLSCHYCVIAQATIGETSSSIPVLDIAIRPVRLCARTSGNIARPELAVFGQQCPRNPGIFVGLRDAHD